jgi:2'-5' RNA ligase
MSGEAGALRLFLALDLPEPHRREIGERCTRLRSRLPPARWTRPESIHLTLAFLGAVERGDLPGLVAAAAPAFARAEPMDLAVEGGGTFPPGRPARVAWVGLEGGPDLSALRQEVAAAACGGLGLEPETRPFHPHVTVARPRRPWNRRASEDFARAFEGRLGEPFRVTEGVLYESELGPGGSRYTALERFRLGG